MADPIIIVEYDPNWLDKFLQIARPIREAMGDTALRIDHIGSTAIPGIAAKPVIDILISVVNFEPFVAIREPLESLGYVWREDNPDKSKRYFREADGSRNVHIHVHKIGTWQQQLVLLFRDYLRQNPEDMLRYEGVKREMAEKFRNERGKYVDAKNPIIWDILRRATSWLQKTGWESGPSDV